MIRKLSVIIPAYNEEKTIAQVIERVKRADICGLELEVVAVNDGSKDRTEEVLKSIPGIRVVSHAKNGGKGSAVKDGFRAATGEVLLIQDADLEYDPGDYKALLRPILDGRCEAVMGSRFIRDRPHFFFGERQSPFFTHYVGNIAIVTLTNLLYGNDATDYEGCFKVFLKKLVDSVPIEADGFEYDNELICKLLRRGCRIEEVPITYSPRSYQEGKKIKWRDGVLMLWTIVRWRFKSF